MPDSTEEMTKVKTFLLAHWITVRDLLDTVEDERVYDHPNKSATGDVLSWMPRYADKPVQALYDAIDKRRRLIQGSVNLYPNQKLRNAMAYAYQALREAIDDSLDPPTFRLLVSNVGWVVNESDPRSAQYDVVKALYDECVAEGYGQVSVWSSKDDDPIESYDNPDAVDGKY